MSDFSVELVKIKGFGKHPNADTLSITNINGGCTLFKTGDFQAGDLAIYIPVDAMVKEDSPIGQQLPFLDFKPTTRMARIKAVKLRGIFSMGVLVKVPEFLGVTEADVGSNLAEKLDITKYEEPISLRMSGEQERDPQIRPTYDIENYRKLHGKIFDDKDEVVLTVKVHGTNFSCGWSDAFGDNRFYVFSHHTCRRDKPEDLYWSIARKYGLEKVMAKYPSMVLYGEIFGAGIQDLTYGYREPVFQAFDIYDRSIGRYLPYDIFLKICQDEGLPTVMEVGRFPYNDEKVRAILADVGKQDPVAKANGSFKQIGEGVVVKGVNNGYTEYGERKILKLVSEEYLLRKNGTEHH